MFQNEPIFRPHKRSYHTWISQLYLHRPSTTPWALLTSSCWLLYICGIPQSCLGELAAVSFGQAEIWSRLDFFISNSLRGNILARPVYLLLFAIQYSGALIPAVSVLGSGRFCCQDRLFLTPVFLPVFPAIPDPLLFLTLFIGGSSFFDRGIIIPKSRSRPLNFN